MALSCGTTSMTFHLATFTNLQIWINKPPGQSEVIINQAIIISWRSADPPRISRPACPLCRPWHSCFCYFFSFDLLEIVFFFFLNHHPANLTAYHHWTDPPVESLAFAPPCIYNNRTTLRARSTYTTSRRPRCGLQQGCYMPQCSHLLAWAMPTFIILHWTQPSVL